MEPQVGDIITLKSDGKQYRVLGINPRTGKLRLEPTVGSEAQTAGEGFARTVAQGATFGFSDELAGLGAALMPGGRGYTEARDKARENLAQFREERPKTALLAEGIGGVATGILGPAALARGGLMARQGLSRLGMASRGRAARTSSDVARAQRTSELAGNVGEGRLRSKILQGAGIGAAEGGVYGFGAGGESRGDNLSSSLLDRVGSAAFGATTGGVMGGGLSGGLVGLGKLGDMRRGAQLQGKIGGGAVEQIDVDVPAGTMPDSGPGGIVETGGTAAIASDDAAAMALAKVEQEANPREYARKAKRWIEEQEALAPSDRSPEYETWSTMGKRSEFAAGMYALAKEAAEREAKSTSAPGLLADRSNVHRATAEVAAQIGARPQQSALRETVQRPGLLGEAVEQVEDALGPRYGPQGVSQVQTELNKEASALAKQNYNAAYSISDAQLALIRADDDIKKALSDIANAGRGVPVIRQEITSAFQAARAEAIDQGNSNLANRLDDTFAELIAKADDNPGVDVLGATIQSIVNNGNPASIDVLRRALSQSKEKLVKGEGANQPLGYSLKSLLNKFDEALDEIAPEFARARQSYSARKGIAEAYEDAATGTVLDMPVDELRQYVDELSNDPVNIARTEGQIELLPGVDQSVDQIQRSEREMFKQGVLDRFLREIAESGDNRSATVAKLQNRFEKLFGGENPIFPDVNAGTVQRIQDELTDIANRADLGDKLPKISDRPAQADLEGAVEATAFGYALAGQPGAAARTGIASLIYGGQRGANLGGAFARRLRQTESQGLLNIADALSRAEGQRLGRMARRQRYLRGSGGLLPTFTESLGTDRYGGYQPETVRRRAMMGLLTQQNN